MKQQLTKILKNKICLRLLFAVLLVAGLTVIEAATFLFWHHSIIKGLAVITVTAGCLIYAALKFKPLPYAILYIAATAMLVTDIHLIVLYNYPFLDIGRQIFTVTNDTNAHEILAYITLLSKKEIAALIFFAAGLFTVKYKPLPPAAGLKATTAVFALFIIAGYTVNFTSPLYKYAVQQKANKETIEAYKQFSFNAEAAENSPEIVVLMIGESHRADYFEKAFEKYAPTFKDMILFKDFISIYPNTNPSFSLILSRRGLLGDTFSSNPYFKEKNIFSLFKEAGYETFYINYLNKNHKGDTRTNIIVSEADHFIKYPANFDNPLSEQHPVSYSNYRKYLQQATNDLDVLPILADVIADNSGKKKFIVIKTIGVHFPQEDRYPDSWDLRQPSMKQKGVSFDRNNTSPLTNTYANAMDFSAYFTYELMDLLKQSPQSVLFAFTSDHGFCMYERGGFNSGDCAEGFHIAALLYGNEPYLTQHKNIWHKVESFEKEPISQQYLFETLASLAGISFDNPATAWDLTKISAVALPTKRETKLLNGTMINYEDLRD